MTAVHFNGELDGSLLILFPPSLYMENLVNLPWAPVHLLISSTALCVGVYVGKTFVIILLLQYLFCKGFQDFSSRSLLLTVSLGAVLLAGFSSFISVIPTLWNKWINIVYFFSSTAFLLHYFFFCLLEFNLTKTNPEIFAVFIFSTCPSVTCFTLTLSLANWFGIPFCILIPFTGFLTLQWCVSCDHWFITGLNTTKANETLWKSLQDMCIFLLLRAFPLVGYFSEITDSFLHHLLNFTLLCSITEILTSLLDYTRSTSVRTRSVWQTSAVHRILFGSLFVISFLLVSLRFVGVARPQEIQMVFLAIGLFICLLGSSFLHIRKPTFSIYRTCSFIFIVLLFFLCLFASSRFPKVANIIPWRGLLPSPFGLTLAICCLCSVVPIALHGYIGDETVHFVIAAFLSAFQLNELYLFQSRLISGNLFIGSSMIILVCLYSFQLLKLKQAYNQNGPITDDLVNIFLIAPLLTKLVLVGLNKWDQFDHGFDIINHAPKSNGYVLRYNSGMVFGLYLSCVGLTNGSRIANWFIRLAHQSRLKLLTLNDAVIGMLGLLFYFIISLGLHWHTCIQLVFGSVQSVDVLFFPVGVLLTGCSIHLSQKWVHQQPVKHIGNNHASYDSIALNFILLSVFSLFAMMSSRTVTFSLLLLTILLPAIVFLLFWAIHRLVFTDSEDFVLSPCWLTRSIHRGLFGGLLFTVLVLWFEPMLSGCALLGCTTLYSTCIGVLIESRNASAHSFSISDNSSFAPASNTFPLQLSDGLDCPHLRSALCLRRTKLRFELIVLLLGFISLGMLPIVRYCVVAGAWTEPSFLIFGTFALAFLLLGQISADRRTTEIQHRRRRKSSAVDAKLQKRCAEDTLLTSVINISVLICVVLLLHGCEWDPSDIRVLFVPWLLFGLVGDWFMRNPIVVPLFGLTVVLATGVYAHSQLHTLPHAPLPTYSGSTLARPTRWSMWRDLYVTCALIPVHLTFLADQTGLSAEQLVSPIVLSIRWLGTLVSLPNWSPCSIAHCLSKVFSLFYRTVYGLSLFCLSYLIYPSCLTSVLFGLYSFGVCCYLVTFISIRTEPAW